MAGSLCRWNTCGLCGRCDAEWESEPYELDPADATVACLICDSEIEDFTVYPFCSPQCALSAELDNSYDE
jgi:hypothetical protein